MERKFGALSSSVNPQELSKSVEAFIKIVGGGLVLLGAVTQTDLNQLTNGLTTAVPAIYVLWNFAELAFGLIRKAVAHFASR